MKARRLLFLLSIFFILTSCAALLEAPSQSSGVSMARLLFYAHSTSLAPDDIEFKISKMTLKGADGKSVSVFDESIIVSAGKLTSRQMLLRDAAVPPGSYSGAEIFISSASIRSAEGMANLSIPGTGGRVGLPLALNVKAGQTLVISFIWDPDNSVEKRYIFSPAIRLEPQIPSARDLLLFVSNSGSNYISVIDRSIERVIAATTVGRNPMGMALNSTGDLLYVVNAGTRNISVVDAQHYDVRDTIELTAGVSPADIAFMPDFEGSVEGKLYVVNRLSDDVSVISTLTKRVLKTIQVGRFPSHILPDAERKEVYVTNELSNNLSIISAVDDTVVSDIEVDNAPSGIALGDESVYVFNQGSNTISRISPSERAVVETFMVSRTPTRGLKAFSGRLFVSSATSDAIAFFDASNVTTTIISAGKRPLNIAADEKRNRLYVTNSGNSTVSIIDPVGERMVEQITVGKSPYGIINMDR